MIRIHVDTDAILANQNEGRSLPPLTLDYVREGEAKPHASEQCDEVDIHGPCQVVYRPHDPIPGGARCWIEVPEGTEISTRLHDRSEGNPLWRKPTQRRRTP